MRQRRLTTWFGRSLRRKLLFSIISAVMIGLVILGILSFLLGRNAVRAEVVNRNAQLAALIARNIDSEFDSTIKNLQVLANQVQAIGLVPLQARALREFRLQSPTTYRALYLVRSDGTVDIDVSVRLEVLAALTSTDSLLPNQMRVPSTLQTAFEQSLRGQTYIAPIVLSQFDQVPTTLVSLPIFNNVGLVESVLIVNVDGRALWRSIDAIRIGTTGRAFIVDGSGIVIAHPQREYIGDKLPRELEAVLRGFEGTKEYVNSRSNTAMLVAFTPITGRVNWNVIVEQDREEALAPVNSIASLTAVVLLLAMATATLAAFIIARSVTRPVQQLAQATQYITQTNDLSHDIPVAGSDEVNQLARSFNVMIDTVRDANERLLAAQAVAQELRIAREIQTILLPSSPPLIEGLDVAAVCVPAREVGGDFYGYYHLTSERTTLEELVVTVGDVSGKGIPAALYMAATSSAFAAKVATTPDMVELYHDLNTSLYRRSTQMRINTALLAVQIQLASTSCQASIINAGLIAPLYRSGDQCLYLDVGGLPLGSMPHTLYHHLLLPLMPNDWLVLCSDGIIEAMNSQREMYGFDRLQACVALANAENAAQMVTYILNDVQQFADADEQHDDMTVVALNLRSYQRGQRSDLLTALPIAD